MGRHADPHAVGIIDETSFAKKGEKTAGVQHQYCGETGKRDNCPEGPNNRRSGPSGVVTVHLAYASKDFATLVDADLFLPPKTWAYDYERRRKAGIPDEVTYRPKWPKVRPSGGSAGPDGPGRTRQRPTLVRR
jgi:SRSO17 transposase